MNRKPAGPIAALRWRHRLEARIAALFLALLLLVQVAGFVPVHRTIDANARKSIAAELQVRAQVFELARKERVRNLARESRVLAQDFGLLAAIVSRDVATIEDALRNAGDRIDARETLLVDASGQLLAATSDAARRLSTLLPPEIAPRNRADSVTIVLLDNVPYLIFAVPINAPVHSTHLIGRVAMAFRVDELLENVRLATALGDGLGAKGRALDAALVLRNPGTAGWSVLQSYGSLAGQDANLVGQLRASDPQADAVFALSVDGAELAGRAVPLEPAVSGAPMLALILVGSVTEAAAPYRDLERTLLLLSLAGFLAFAIGSVLTARRIANPIQSLSRAAARLAQGDYATAVAASGPSEIQDLARGFENMRQAVHTREESIRRLAFWDPLTDLPNRTQFVTTLGTRIAAAAPAKRACAVLMLDLDRFKPVNDVLGQAIGDRVLQKVAQRMASECVQPGDMLARLGGDEFAILMPGNDPADALARGQRIQVVFETPIVVDDQTIDLGASVGIALHPADGSDVNELLAHAEIAMYAAKRQRAGALRYAPGLDTSSEASLSLLSQLRTAVAEDQLRLYLQPKVRLHDGVTIGVEALVRWVHPERGLVPPMEFIPFAEQTGFIRHITKWMIEQSIAWLAREEIRASGLRLSMNLSVRDLLDHDLAARVADCLQRHGVRPDRLGLEITESAMMDDPKRAQATVAQLHHLGVWLSVDDYGTGFSSLAYLQSLQIDELKIDKSFVMKMSRDDGNAKIVRSTIELGHTLGLSVVAEGVETADAWNLLAAWDCDDAQGFLMGKPMEAKDFPAWRAHYETRTAVHGAEIV